MLPRQPKKALWSRDAEGKVKLSGILWLARLHSGLMFVGTADLKEYTYELEAFPRDLKKKSQQLLNLSLQCPFLSLIQIWASQHGLLGNLSVVLGYFQVADECLAITAALLSCWRWKWRKSLQNQQYVRHGCGCFSHILTTTWSYEVSFDGLLQTFTRGTVA